MGRFFGLLLLVGVVGAASARGAAASGWSLQHTPNPAGATSSHLNGVSCASGSACTSVGYYDNGTTDLTLAERWNGTKWSIQKPPTPSGGTGLELTGVSCTSASACTAVGYYYNGTTDVTLAERWNGTKWSIQKPPNPTGGTDSQLDGVTCTSGSACTAVGEYYSGTAQVTLAERWNGTKWSLQTTPNPTGAPDSGLLGVSCTSKSACIAVGFAYAYATLAERWNGTKWSLQTTPNPTDSTESQLYGVSCASASACSAVGYYFSDATLTLGERWNGTKWSLQTTANPVGATASQLNGVYCTSVSACTAVGYYGNGTTDVTLAERWNGTKWSIQKPPNPTGGMDNELYGVSCSSRSACTAVGYYNNGSADRTLVERWKGG